MKLRTKIFIAVFAVAVVLIAIATISTRQILADSYREDYESLRAEVTSAISRELALRQQLLVRVADSLASPQHSLTAAVLDRMEQQHGTLSAGDRQYIGQAAQAAMVALGIDELVLVGDDQRVIAAPHHPQLVGELAAQVWGWSASSPSGAGFSSELSGGGEVRGVATRTISEGAYEIAMLVGRRLDDSLLQVAARPGLVEARLVALDERVLLATEETKERAGTAPTLTVPLLDWQDKPVAFVQAFISDETLGRVLTRLTFVALAASVTALLLAGILATWLSRRVTRRMDELVLAAHAVARGDYTQRVSASGADELAQLGGVFNHMVQQVNQSKERLAWVERTAAWQDIARHLAHEIKNPLTPIQMSMDTLRRSYERKHPEFGEILAESTQTVLEEAARLKKFATEFGNFARLPKPERSVFDLAALVRGLVALRGDVALAAPNTPVMIDADRDQLTQVLHNLLDNAADATAQVREIRPAVIAVTLAVEPSEQGDAGNVPFAVLTVRDNGTGLDGAVRAQLFTPYVTSKLDRGGTGLGLAIVHRIVTEHGGTIAVEDGEPGTTFVVRLAVVGA